MADTRRGSKVSHSSCKDTKPILGGSTFTTSPNPNDLPKAPPPNTITSYWWVGFQQKNWRGYKHSVHNRQLLLFSFWSLSLFPVLRLGVTETSVYGFTPSSILLTPSMTSSMPTALMITSRLLIPICTSLALSYASILFFLMFSEKKIQGNDLKSPQIHQIELDISADAQMALNSSTVYTSWNHFFFLKIKSVLKFHSEMEITFLLSLYTSSGWRNYMLRQLSALCTP